MVQKLCGADIELGNFVLGLERRAGTGFEASRALLREIDGISGGALHVSAATPRVSGGASHVATGRDAWSADRWGASSYDAWPATYRDGGGAARDRSSEASPFRGDGYDPQDWGRRFLASNGGCVYIDLDHLELCLPEVRSAFDHVACWHAMLRIAQGALDAANARLGDGLRIQALANNSDGRGNSYGSHLDFLVTRRAWANLIQRKPHHLGYLAAYQASSIVFTGQGKVGAENGMPEARFQLSQRADFIETLTGPQTTSRRPLVNSRDEPLCGSRWRSSSGYGHKVGGREDDRPLSHSLARLHVIFFDNTLCQVASLLKVGVLQIILAMLEADRIDPGLALDDPLLALWVWSRDPGLGARATLVSRKRSTAVELQLRFLERARRFVDTGGCDGIVPRAAEILDLWEDTLVRLETGDLAGLARRLDWVLKLSILERVLEGRPDLGWDSPELKHLDLVYSSLDPREGLYWSYAAAGQVDETVPTESIERFTVEPPPDTRAWGRAMLLRRAGPDRTAKVDWDRLELRPDGARGLGYWPRPVEVDLSDPLGSTRDLIGPAFEETEGEGLDRLIERLEETPADPADMNPRGLLPPDTRTWRTDHGSA